jgi:prepilin-type N-terminal cleavage/methylation domain-containing protein
MICRKTLNQGGFTLIETIVTVVIVAILWSMIIIFLTIPKKDTTGNITYIKGSFMQSIDPVKRLQKTSDLNRIMANIMADYNCYPKWRSDTIFAGNSFVVPTIRNGHYYKCTTLGGGMSGSVEEPPNWSLAASGTKSDGAITWIETTENGPLLTLSNLQTNINNNNYGTYDVVYNNYIQFVSDTETPGGNNILKVTIKNDQGGNLTALFIAN